MMEMHIYYWGGRDTPHAAPGKGWSCGIATHLPPVGEGEPPTDD
jgi:hypothetical protein